MQHRSDVAPLFSFMCCTYSTYKCHPVLSDWVGKMPTQIRTLPRWLLDIGPLFRTLPRTSVFGWHKMHISHHGVLFVRHSWCVFSCLMGLSFVSPRGLAAQPRHDCCGMCSSHAARPVYGVSEMRSVPVKIKTDIDHDIDIMIGTGYRHGSTYEMI